MPSQSHKVYIYIYVSYVCVYIYIYIHVLDIVGELYHVISPLFWHVTIDDPTFARLDPMGDIDEAEEATDDCLLWSYGNLCYSMVK